MSTLTRLQKAEIIAKAHALALAKSEADRNYIANQRGAIKSTTELDEYRVLENYLNDLELSQGD